jgi:hypothetical protein
VAVEAAVEALVPVQVQLQAPAQWLDGWQPVEEEAVAVAAVVVASARLKKAYQG